MNLLMLNFQNKKNFKNLSKNVFKELIGDVEAALRQFNGWKNCSIVFPSADQWMTAIVCLVGQTSVSSQIYEWIFELELQNSPTMKLADAMNTDTFLKAIKLQFSLEPKICHEAAADSICHLPVGSEAYITLMRGGGGGESK